ncbi:MAG: hydroxyacid dehydrogenase [Chloroflexi bacterium]|nr:hydroxyacid dehydrogenase [Chloroflexota bacterium]
MKPRVLVLAPFSQAGLVEIREFADVAHEDWRASGRLQDPEELGRRLNAEGLAAVVVEADFLFDETFAAAPGLQFAGICRAALNQIDIEAATKRGVVVVNTPGRNAEAVAEMTIGLVFALARRIPEADRYVRGGRWESPTAPYTALRGIELSGRTIGIIGMGAIGRRVASLAQALGMHVLGFDPYLEHAQIEAAGARPCALDEVLARSDFLTLHARPADNGSPLLDAKAISRIKAGACLVNTASPTLVDSQALAVALKSGRLAGAAIDVFETHPLEPGHPLLSIDSAVLTPHIGGATDETVERHSRAMAADLRRYFTGERPLNLVNPEVWQHRRGARQLGMNPMAGPG